MQKIKIGKNYFRFHIIGEGQPILFISGLGMDKAIWSNLIHKIKNNFQIIYFDNRGVGDNNSLTAPVTTKTMANDVIKIIEFLDQKNVWVVGHSPRKIL